MLDVESERFLNEPVEVQYNLPCVERIFHAELFHELVLTKLGEA